METLAQRCVAPLGQHAPVHVRGRRSPSSARASVAAALRVAHITLAARVRVSVSGSPAAHLCARGWTSRTVAIAASGSSRQHAVAAPAAGPLKASSAQEHAAPAPSGCARYETMLILRPNATETERDAELAKIATFLGERGAVEYVVTTRPELSPGKSAYPIKGHSTVYYVQLNYAAPPATVKAMHEMFAVPVVGAEAVLLRYLSFRQSKVTP